MLKVVPSPSVTAPVPRPPLLAAMLPSARKPAGSLQLERLPRPAGGEVGGKRRAAGVRNAAVDQRVRPRAQYAVLQVELEVDRAAQRERAAVKVDFVVGPNGRIGEVEVEG